jgi:hypothetical protein
VFKVAADEKLLFFRAPPEGGTQQTAEARGDKKLFFCSGSYFAAVPILPA